MTKHDRYNHSEKGRARRQRYEDSEKGQTRRQRRVFGASGYIGMSPTIDQAAHLTGLGREFRDRQNQG